MSEDPFFLTSVDVVLSSLFHPILACFETSAHRIKNRDSASGNMHVVNSVINDT